VSVALLSSYPDPLKLPQGLPCSSRRWELFRTARPATRPSLAQWTSSDAAKLPVSDAAGRQGPGDGDRLARERRPARDVTASKPGAPAINGALTLRLTFPQPTAISPQPSDFTRRRR